MIEWQPIETAPMDGTAILIYEPHDTDRFSRVTPGVGPHQGLCIGVARWIRPDMDPDYWGDAFDMSPLMEQPTHWMPLPKFPEDVA